MSGDSFFSQNDISKAVIAVMNGVRLKDADAIYGDGTNASYGRIRGAIFKFCKDRNPTVFEKLRSEDASRKTLKRSKRYDSADVSYVSLQHARHHFLEPIEISDFMAYTEKMAECTYDTLISRKARYEAQLSQWIATRRSLGTVTQSNLIEISKMVDMIALVDSDIDDCISMARLMSALAHSASKHQTLESIAEFERKMKK